MYYEEICGLYFVAPAADKWSWPQHLRHYLAQVKLESHTTIGPTCYSTVLNQTFSNSSENVIPQARYTFPLYDGVAVSGYTITYADKTLKGIVQQKETAKKTYQDAVERGETAGLLESLPAGIFGVTLGNIPAKTDVNVSINYCQELKHDAAIDGLRYILPTSIAPRYGDYPGTLLPSTASDEGRMSITVDVDMTKNCIRKVQSPSHHIAVSMGSISTLDHNDAFDSTKASATLTHGTAELAGDFVLQLLIDNISEPRVMVEMHPNLPSRALMATLVPKFNLGVCNPEIVFIADQSGSMGGSKNKALVSALKVFIKSLPIGVRFNICAFGSTHRFLWSKSQPYNEANMNAAIKFVNTFRAEYGGTELFNPVKEAFNRRLGDLELEIMLLTDGEIWNEGELFDFIDLQLVEESVDARVFALGIGSNVSHTLVEGVARAGNGFAQFVTEDEQTDQKVVRMLKGALYPHTKDYTLEVTYADDAVDQDDFELVERVEYCLHVDEHYSKLASDSVQAQDDQAQAMDTSLPSATAGKPISFFDASADLDEPIKTNDADRYAHLPRIEPPRILQAPSKIAPLFPFNQTTIYLIFGPDAPQRRISSVTLRATSAQGPLELTIPASQIQTTGTTVHQLAARKAIQDLEEGRGWLQTAKTVEGVPAKDKSRFDELVEREAVRLGERFQVAGKWTSFVAVQDSPNATVEIAEVDEPTADEAPPYRSRVLPPPSFGMAAPASFASAHLRRVVPKADHSASVSIAQIAPPPALSGINMCQYADPDLTRELGAACMMPDSDEIFDAQQCRRIAPPLPAKKKRSKWPGNVLAAVGLSGGQARSEDEEDLEGNPAVAEQVALAKGGPHLLIHLQTFSGAWQWTEKLFAAMDLASADKRPAFDAVFGSEDIMATVLAIAYLETELRTYEDVWEMVVVKARAWVGAQVGDEAVDGLVNNAKGMLSGEK
ncbi:hypothetical protein WHR41_06206 [Cladosporium halotolerans]|uniref:Uncharacterized protein n=1 Tax=Cladosporium halotolerans TaxID=1052096 RepID=A0AB34KLG5_9PEZI